MKTAVNTNQHSGRRDPLLDHPRSLGALSTQRSFVEPWAPFSIWNWFQNPIPCAQRNPLSCLQASNSFSTQLEWRKGHEQAAAYR
jgi:hypothetical protein